MPRKARRKRGTGNMVVIMMCLIIILFASGIQGLTSFGFAMIAIPLLTLFLPLKIVTPLLIIYSLLVNVIIIYKIKEYIQIQKMVYLIISGIIGTPLGIYLLLVIEEDILKAGVGIVILLAAGALYYGCKANIKNQKLANIITGLLSGILNGSLAMSGPPVILFLKNEDVEKQIFRANLAFYFAIIDLLTIPILIYGGLITQEVLRYTLFLLPGLIIGAWLGMYFSNKVNNEIFKRFTLYLIAVMGVLSIVSSVIK